MQKVLKAFEREIFPKIKQGKELTSISDRVARVAKFSEHKVFDRKVFNHKQLKNINSETNALKITNRTWTSRSR